MIAHSSAHTIAVSPRKGTTPIVVFIYRDNSCFKSIELNGIQTYYFKENEILKMVLEKNAILTKLFHNTITIKDDLNIIPIIMNVLSTLRLYDSTVSKIGKPGDLIVTFYNVGSPTEFVNNTYIPFMEMAKGYLEKCPFILSYNEHDGANSVSLIFEHHKTDFSISEFERILVYKFAELNLHSIGVERFSQFVSMNDSIRKILQQVSDQMILVYHKDGNDDTIIRTLISYYLNIGRCIEPNIQSFLSINSRIYERMLLNSISPLSSRLLEHIHILNVCNKLSCEYDKLYQSNMEELYSYITHIVQNWHFSSPLSDFPYSTIHKISSKEKKEEFIQNVYSGLFSASIMHPYYTAFVPYCIDKILRHLISNEI